MDSGLKQVKLGAIISYILMVVNLIYGLWLTPFLIGNLGADEYGLYKIVGSLSSSLVVLNLGIGNTVQRYVSLYNVRNEKEKIPNLLAMCLRVSLILNGVIILVGVVVILIFPSMYSNTLTAEQLSKANILLAILIFSLMITVIENLFFGLLSGFNNFIFSNTIKLVSILISAGLTYLLVSGGGDSIALVSVSLVTGLFLLVAEWIYSRKKLGVRFHFTGWDRSLFKEAGKYTLMMFLTALASQAFTNVDTIVIGAFLGTAIVTVYSVGQVFFNLFQQISCAISGVMLPTITRALNEENGLKEAEKLVIGAGRIQFLLLGAALAGVICVGKEFIYLWLGEGFEDVYILILILVGPSLFELCTNVCNSVLSATNKIAFRTYVLIISAVINAILTVILVKEWSFMGAAVATAFSYISCSLITMNIYYVKVMKMDMLSIYRGIVHRLWICILIPSGALLLLNQFISGFWGAFILKVLIFGIIYLAALLLFGLNDWEKRQIPVIGRFLVKDGGN